jgi:hypothetical protein
MTMTMTPKVLNGQVRHPAVDTPGLLTDRTSSRSSVSVQTSSTYGSSNAAPPWSGQNQRTPLSSVAMEGGIRGCCEQDGGDLVPHWIEWIESGIEFFGCDENAPGESVFGRTVLLRHVPANEPKEPTHNDYGKLHDEFIESLLHEQVKLSVKQHPQHAAASAPPVEDAIPDLQTAPSGDSNFSGISNDSSYTAGAHSLNSMKTHKRARMMRMNASQRTSPNRARRGARVAPIETYTKKYQPKQAEELCFTDLAAGNHPKPSTMVHPDCKLQKDKGKGEPLGSAISATGRDACLDKLRQKMELLMQVALGEDRKGPTGMKRRSAKVSEERANFVETRSMIELRLGFLSMQYGVLIQWDSLQTGKIMFIVLRKMCHDSFYNKLVARPSDPQHQHPSTATTITRKQLEAPPLVIRNLNGNHAIYQRPSGTEVVFVDPPYRIPQPEVFAPSVLSVEINHAVGLSKNSSWTISLTFDKNTEELPLFHMAEKHQWQPRQSNTMHWEMADVTSFDLAGLEIRLFEQRKGLRVQNRLAATMTMPLGGLVAQPSTSQANSWQVTIPCSHDQKASVTFSFSHQSDYAHWLYKELDARRREEVTGFVWKAPFRRVVKEIKGDEADDGGDDFIDWICGFCFGEDQVESNKHVDWRGRR